MKKHDLLPLLLAGLLGVPGCELFGLDDAELEINVPRYTIDAVDVPLQSLPVRVPEGKTVKQWLGAPPSPINLLDADPRLEKYQRAIRRIEIRNIFYSIPRNELSADLPGEDGPAPLEIYFGPEGIDASLDDPTKDSRAVEYGKTEGIRARVVIPELQAIEPLPGAPGKVADQMSKLAFSSLAGFHVVLTEDTPIPSGRVQLSIGLELTVFVEPY